MDPISVLGYSRNSPYKSNPFLDIFTPEGLIDMSNTDIDLMGIDNLGNKKKMKAGTKNPYKFDGQMVREIPMQMGGIKSYNPNLATSDSAFQKWYSDNIQSRSGVPYSDKLNYDYYSYYRNGEYKNGPAANGHYPDTYKRPNHPTFSDESIYSVPDTQGGKWKQNSGKWSFIPSVYNMSNIGKDSLIKYFNQYEPDSKLIMQQGGNNPYQKGGMTNKALFDFIFDDEEPDSAPNPIPTAPTTEEVDEQSQMDELDQQRRNQADQENNDLAMSIIAQDRGTGNPYSDDTPQQLGNPYSGPILSEGEFKDQNVGEYGKQIYGQLASDLGYSPVVNSIFRSKAQNDELIAKGLGAVPNSWHLSGNAIDLKPADWHKLSDKQQQFYRMNYGVVYHNNHYHIQPK